MAMSRGTSVLVEGSIPIAEMNSATFSDVSWYEHLWDVASDPRVSLLTEVVSHVCAYNSAKVSEMSLA